ncbi:MAG: hypothetical protein FVQ83_14650 [Chloroflexi bacterium]|nr:hypothetical protein [Chloroflexota bacterium]
MQNPNIDETQPNEVQNINDETSLDETQPHLTEIQRSDKPESVPDRHWKRWLITGLIGFIAVVSLAILGGIQTGKNTRSLGATLDVDVLIIFHFEKGEQDLQNNDCEHAIQRFEFVIQKDPNFPGIDEKLAQAMMCSNQTATPTLAPTPTLTPTPDLRSVEEQFASAQALFIEENWDTLLETLDSLRDNYPSYMTLEIDRLYYLGLRNRGVQRILVDGNLEGGIFDLNRVEQDFGTLDAQADGYRSWARLYINGSSYWAVEWEQAVYYFAQLAPLAPNLWDGSYFTVDRLATAQVEYSYELVERGVYYLSVRGWCEAMEDFDYASIYIQFDPTPAAEATRATYRCEPPPPPPQATESSSTEPPSAEPTPIATPER